jgi:hypothetical protein
MDAADGGAGVMIGRGGDGASVEHHQFRLGGCQGARQALFQEIALHGGAIGLGGSASEVFYKEGAHWGYYNKHSLRSGWGAGAVGVARITSKTIKIALQG